MDRYYTMKYVCYLPNCFGLNLLYVYEYSIVNSRYLGIIFFQMFFTFKSWVQVGRFDEAQLNASCRLLYFINRVNNYTGIYLLYGFSG